MGGKPPGATKPTRKAATEKKTSRTRGAGVIGWCLGWLGYGIVIPYPG